MAAYEILLLNTTIPQIQAAQSGDTYVVPRDIAFSTVASFAAGAEATPSIVATGDTNTGIWFPAADTVAISTGGISRLRLDSSGNLGLGVTPSAWTDYRAMQFGTLGAIAFDGGSSMEMFSNVYYASGAFRYISSSSSAKPTRYAQGNGSHYWYTAASGTAGNAISFTQAMTLDASGRLGIGVTNPAVGLVVAYGTDGIIGGYYSSSGNNSRISFSNVSLLNNNVSIGSASDALVMYTNNTERARITSGGVFQVSSGGSVQVGGTAARATTAGTNRLDIFNGTAPVGTLTNGISIYSSSGEAYVMDAAGNATLFSPHDAETNEWIFKSKHTPTGKVLKIDVERLLKFVNDHFGLDAVHEFVEE